MCVSWFCYRTVYNFVLKQSNCLTESLNTKVHHYGFIAVYMVVTTMSSTDLYRLLT